VLLDRVEGQQRGHGFGGDGDAELHLQGKHQFEVVQGVPAGDVLVARVLGELVRRDAEHVGCDLTNALLHWSSP